jgi:hypothetical protein
MVLASAVRAEEPVHFNDVSIKPEEPVHFNDPNLKAAVESTLRKRDPTPTDMLSLTGLSTGWRGIVSLVGLEHATNVESLHVGGNQISDISALTGLIHLTHLDLTNNPITDIQPLSGLTNLTELWLPSNQISDISALAGLTNLTFLYLADNQISDISALTGLIHLTFLHLGSNQISDISALAGLTNLTELMLHVNQITDIRPLSGLTNLIVLLLLDNQISDISALAGLTNLTRLHLGPNQVTDIRPVSGLTNLTDLMLYGNQIRDISALEGMTKLANLDLGKNPLNAQAYRVYIPRILANNPGIQLSYYPPVWRTLTVSSSEGGSVLTPGEGRFQFVKGDVILIEAVPSDPNHDFSAWSGTAVDAGKVQDSNAATTTVVVDANYTLQAVFATQSTPAFGFSIGEIGMDDPQQFESRVFTNSTAGSTLVDRVTGQTPDPKGMMAMHVIDGGPAQAKGRFGKCIEDRIWIEFKYLFESPDVVMVVYLSDSPQVGDRDPNHVQEVARLVPPAQGRPGSVGSGRFGQFEQWVDTAGLDLTQGTWVELELVRKTPIQMLRVNTLRRALGGIASAGGTADSVMVDDWSMNVHCSGICMDLNWSTTTNVEDFLLVMAAVGHSVGSGSDRLYCCEGLFSKDAYIDSSDLPSWDWVVKNHLSLLNLCDSVPLGPCTTCGGTAAALVRSMRVPFTAFYAGLPEGHTGWVVLGKRTGTGLNLDDRMKDGLYLLDGSGRYDKGLSLRADRCNVRSVQCRDDRLYLIHSEAGIVHLEADGSTVSVVPVGTRSWSSDPRYNKAATISIGIQNQGTSVSGRPILDAAITGNSAYVVPVVVSPTGAEPYVAAARLDLRPWQSPPYEVNQVYDDPGMVNKDLLDNPNLSGLREIEVDDANNVYVLNAHGHNESDVLWKYGVDGKVVQHRFLADKGGQPREPDPNVPDPIGLCVDNSRKRVYMASGLADPNDPNSACVKGFSTEDLSLQRMVRIRGMQHVTAMGLKGQTGVLWVVGYRVKDEPNPDDPSILPECEPCLAEISVDATDVNAVSLAGTTGDLALPMSIVWMGQ